MTQVAGWGLCQKYEVFRACLVQIPPDAVQCASEALTIAKMPARIAGERRCQAVTTDASSRSSCPIRAKQNAKTVGGSIATIYFTAG